MEAYPQEPTRRSLPIRRNGAGEGGNGAGAAVVTLCARRCLRRIALARATSRSAAPPPWQCVASAGAQVGPRAPPRMLRAPAQPVAVRSRSWRSRPSSVSTRPRVKRRARTAGAASAVDAAAAAADGVHTACFPPAIAPAPTPARPRRRRRRGAGERGGEVIAQCRSLAPVGAGEGLPPLFGTHAPDVEACGRAGGGRRGEKGAVRGESRARARQWAPRVAVRGPGPPARS